MGYTRSSISHQSNNEDIHLQSCNNNNTGIDDHPLPERRRKFSENSFQTPPSLKKAKGKSKKLNEMDSNSKAKNCGCLVCEKETPFWLLTRNPTWSSIMRVVFYALMQMNPGKKYFSLRTEVYSYVVEHWHHLCASKTCCDNWKKQLQDTLSHNKKLFVSGFEQHKQNGFWGLKQVIDPWEVTDDCAEENSLICDNANPSSGGGKILSEYKDLKSDILKTLDRLEESVFEIKTQVQSIPNITNDDVSNTEGGGSKKCSSVDELEDKLQQIWAKTDQELRAVSEEILAIYDKSNQEVDLISLGTKELLELHTKDFLSGGDF